MKDENILDKLNKLNKLRDEIDELRKKRCDIETHITKKHIESSILFVYFEKQLRELLNKETKEQP